MGVNPTAIINGLGGGGGASADIIDYSQSDAKMLLALSQNPMDEDLRRKSSEAFLENFAEKIEKKMIAAGQTPTPAQVQEVMANEIIRGLEEATGAQSSDDAKTKIKALMEQSPSDFAQAMVDDYALVKARNARIVEERNAAAKADPPRQAQAEPQVGLMAILMTPVDVNGNQVTPRVDQIDVSNVDVDPYSQARASDNGLFAAAFSCMTDGGGCNGLARLYGVSFANINKDEYLVDGPRSEYERRALITGSLVGVPNANSSHGSEHSAIRFTQSVQYPPGVGDTLTYNAHIIAAFEKGGFTFEDDAAKQAMLVEMVRLADEGLRQRDFVKAINKFVVGHDGVTSNSEVPGLLGAPFNPANMKFKSLSEKEYDAEFERTNAIPVDVTKDPAHMAAMAALHRNGGGESVQRYFNAVSADGATAFLAGESGVATIMSADGVRLDVSNVSNFLMAQQDINPTLAPDNIASDPHYRASV